MTEGGSVRRRGPRPLGAPADDQLVAQLRPGEKLRWAGRPDPRIYAASKAQPGFYGLIIVVLWLLWLVIALFEEGHAQIGKLEVIGYSLPFLLPGLVLMLIPLRSALHARSVAYGITDRRLLIVAEKPRRAVLSFAPNDIEVIERFDYENGLGSIFFHYTVAHSRKAWRHYFRWGRVGFFGVDEPAAVEAMIRDLARLRTQR